MIYNKDLKSVSLFCLKPFFAPCETVSGTFWGPIRAGQGLIPDERLQDTGQRLMQESAAACLLPVVELLSSYNMLSLKAKVAEINPP